MKTKKPDEGMSQSIQDCQDQVQSLTTDLANLEAERMEQKAVWDQIAAEVEAAGPQEQHRLNKVEQHLRNLESQKQTIQEELARAESALGRLERAATSNHELAESRLAKIDEAISKSRQELSGLEQAVSGLYDKLVEDPDNADTQDAISKNEDQQRSLRHSIAAYERARANALTEYQDALKSAMVRNALQKRDDAFLMAQKRVDVAKRIDAWLDGLAPLLREWREVDNGVSRSASDAVLGFGQGASFDVRNRLLASAELTAPRNCIAKAVAQSLCVSNLQDVLRDHIQLNYTSVLEAQRNPLTAEGLAAQAAERLVNGLTVLINDEVAKHG